MFSSGASSDAFTLQSWTCAIVLVVLRSDSKEQNKLSFVLVLVEMSDIYTIKENP